jgi:hypothetical protein
MSLTVFVGKKAPEVIVVLWFREPAYPNSYVEHPSGPMVQLSLKEFRSEGAEFVRRHFEAYETIRMTEKDATPVFTKEEGRKLLKERSAVGIDVDYFNDRKGLRLGPYRFKSYSLGGLVDLGKEYHRCLPENWTAGEFWNCFDAVLSDAS